MNIPQKKSISNRFIAFYLPQYHPIPENDEWWGKGFTEWTNVAKAKPLFKEHYQPHLPADLGFYDLRVPEVREQQAELAREAGIEGFCYWHYWFAGKRLLERPFNEVLETGKPDFPFCLAWANITWSGIWKGAPNRVLIEQTFPGKQDYQTHFYEVLKAFQDPRYMTVDGKPIFILQHPTNLPDSQIFTEFWQELALKEGLKGIFFLGIEHPDWNYEKDGFDGVVMNNMSMQLRKLRKQHNHLMDRAFKKIIGKYPDEWIRIQKKEPLRYLYEAIIETGVYDCDPDKNHYQTVYPNWDNTPRSHLNGFVFHNSIPDLFKIQLREAIEKTEVYDLEHRLIFIKSWNEWAEGNYLEPDQKFGKQYLEVIRSLSIGN